MAVCYFEPGLKSNEFCLWAVSDPISLRRAEQALRRAIPGFDRYRAAGQIELLAGTEWYLRGNEFDLQRITAGWNEKLSAALATGHDGVRASGNAFWLRTKHWKAFCDHEYKLDGSLAGRKMICSVPIRCRQAEASTCLMWRVRVNAPSCGEKAIGNSWRLPNSSGPSRKC